MGRRVLKIQHGEILRRRTLPTGDGVMLSYAQLLSSARSLFRIPATAPITFTYEDRQFDTVTLADDEDLEDALVLQGLNPLKVIMKVGAQKSGVRQDRSESEGNQESEESEDEDSAGLPDKFVPMKPRPKPSITVQPPVLKRKVLPD